MYRILLPLVTDSTAATDHSTDRIVKCMEANRYSMTESRAEQTDEELVTVTVVQGESTTELTATRGILLRDLLLAHDYSPYTALTERANCGGRGLCATCGVRLYEGPEPTHWHDRLAARFGYPRLSCQVTVDDDMTVKLVEDKRIWGGRESRESPNSSR